jgi:membrane protease YdiL (CAAX protease family)
LSGGDLLLLLIFGLGAVRVLAAFFVASLGLAEPNVEPDGKPILVFTVLLLLAQTAAILAAVHVIAIRKHGLSWAEVGLRPAESRWYIRSVAVGGFMVPMVGLINYLIGQIEGRPFENPQIYAIAPDGFSWMGLILMIVMAGAVAPIAEEIAFRGVFFPWLRERIGLFAGVVLSAIAFAMVHGVVQLMPSLAVVGAVLAVLYHRCGSLYPVIVAHGVFNTIMIVALYSALAGATAPS